MAKETSLQFVPCQLDGSLRTSLLSEEQKQDYERKRSRHDGRDLRWVELLLAKLLYGTGMRLNEGLHLRVRDVDFDRHVIIVREAKGNKDRVVMLPRSLVSVMRMQLLAARAVWEADRQAQRGGVETPHALEQEYPKVGQTWGWFWMLPSPTRSIDPRSGVERQSGQRWSNLSRPSRSCIDSSQRPLNDDLLHV